MKDQLAIIHRQDAFVKIPEPGSEAKAPLGKQNLSKYALLSKRSGFALATLPFPKAIIAPQEVSLSPIGKTEPNTYIVFPQHYNTLPKTYILVSPHGDHCENQWGYTIGYQLEVEKAVEAHSNHHTDLGRLYTNWWQHMSRNASQKLFPFAEPNQ